MRSDRLLCLHLSKTISLVPLLALSILSSCGTPGIPLPPSLDLPKPVTDLHAKRKGDKVYLTWTEPARTTDRQPIRHFGTTRICRSGDRPLETCPAIAEVPSIAPKIPSNINATSQPETYTDILPESALTSPFADLTYGVEVMNDRGRSAGLSNKVHVPAAHTLPPPGNFAAEVTADGVVLRWVPVARPVEIPGLHFLYRIYRREENSTTETIAGELPLDATPNSRFVDHTFEWEKKYSYHATVITLIGKSGSKVQVEGDDTPEAAIFTHDIFPPAVPSGLQAVFSSENGKLFVDLIWNPDTESGLAGYNVFRSVDGAPAIKINSDLVKLPAFRDMNATSGKKYYYSVSAVDVSGNESARSEEANEAVP